jgi:hypothetical protein
MTRTKHISPKFVLVVALAATALALPIGASATTGIETSTSVRVLLTDKGAVWTPALSKLHPDTDTTYEIKVVNRATRPGRFKLGYRSTKLLPKGQSQFFYFSFHVIGPVKWTATNGTVKSSTGTFHVKLQKSFSGG